jgi:hypothetical protein
MFYPQLGKLIFFISPTNFWADSVIANLQISYVCQSANRKSANFNWGKINVILSPCVYTYFCNLGHAIIAPPFRPWIRGKNGGKRKIKSYFSLEKDFYFL